MENQFSHNCPSCDKLLQNHSTDDFIKCLNDLSSTNTVLFDENNPDPSENILIVHMVTSASFSESEISIAIGGYGMVIPQEKLSSFRKAIDIVDDNIQKNGVGV